MVGEAIVDAVGEATDEDAMGEAVGNAWGGLGFRRCSGTGGGRLLRIDRLSVITTKASPDIACLAPTVLPRRAEPSRTRPRLSR